MSKRIYIQRKCVHKTIYHRYYGRDNKDSNSITLYVEYVWNRPERIQVIQNVCSESCKEEYGDYDLETFLTINGDAAKKLASKFSAFDADTLLRRMADMFEPYGWQAFGIIENWLKKKEIEYYSSIY